LHGGGKAGSFADDVYAWFVLQQLLDRYAHNLAVVG
jgi:hypothetical protein